MEERYREYLGLLRELGRILDQLTEIAGKKMEAVKRDDLPGLDECIRQEQALSLFLRNIEQKRDLQLKALGMPDIPLSGMVAYFPESMSFEAKAAAEMLRFQYDIYRSASGTARTMLECGLHQIEKMFRQEAEKGGEPAAVPPLKADIRA